MIKIKNKKLLLTICSVLIVSAGAIGVTLSSFTSKDEVVNNFEVGNIDIENEENFPENQPTNKPIIKEVKINNTSTKNPALVRVNITPRWVDEDGEPWSGDVSNKIITLEFDNNLDNSATYPGKNKWMDGNDGYYYYTSILPINTKTSQILKSVKITLKDAQGKDLVENPKDYEGKTLIVDVNSEAIQPTQQAYIDAWNVQDANIIKLLNRLLGVNNGR